MYQVDLNEGCCQISLVQSETIDVGVPGLCRRRWTNVWWNTWEAHSLLEADTIWSVSWFYRGLVQIGREANHHGCIEYILCTVSKERKSNCLYPIRRPWRHRRLRQTAREGDLVSRIASLAIYQQPLEWCMASTPIHISAETAAQSNLHTRPSLWCQWSLVQHPLPWPPIACTQSLSWVTGPELAFAFYNSHRYSNPQVFKLNFQKEAIKYLTRCFWMTYMSYA